MKRLIFALIIFSIGINLYAEKTEGEIILEIRRKVFDKIKTGVDNKWTDAEIRTAINDAQNEICDATWCLNNTITGTLAARTTTYILTDDVFDVYRVIVGTMTIQRYDKSTLDAEYPEWHKHLHSGYPSVYTLVRSTTVVKLEFYPANSASKAISVDYIEIPDQFTATTSTATYPFNQIKRLYPYHDLIVLRASSLLLLEKNETDFYTIYAAEYFNKLANMEQTIRMKPGERRLLITSPYKRPEVK